MPLPVIIDTDPGIDDALALLLALRSPELYVHAITVVGGNVGLAECVRNATGIVALAGAAVPVAAGLQAPHSGAGHVHGNDGLAGLSSSLPKGWQPVTASAVDLLLECAEGMTLVALGPLTSVAAAARKNPARFRKFSRIIAMGGAFRHHGNVTAVAEFNMHADPDAANAVLASGVPIALVPLDVTSRVGISRDMIQTRSETVQRLCAGITEIHGIRGFDGFYPHDPLAVAVAIDPGIVRTEPVSVEVETSGRLTRGMTVADFRPWSDRLPNAHVAMEVDVSRFYELFCDRVLSGDA